MNNKDWSEKILKKFDPNFKHRWAVYNDLLIKSLNSDTIWVDCGCGQNFKVEDFGKFAKTAVGVDIINPVIKKNYIKADIRQLPFKSNCVDLLTLGFVVEHFKESADNISEISRVVKKGCKVIILTTNLLSPLIFLPKLFLPYPLKNKILTKLFKVKDDEVFPTYHKLNTPNKFLKLRDKFEITEMIYISDMNYTRRWIFLILFIVHLLIKPKFLNKYRTNILVVLQKK